MLRRFSVYQLLSTIYCHELSGQCGRDLQYLVMEPQFILVYARIKMRPLLQELNHPTLIICRQRPAYLQCSPAVSMAC